MGLAHLPTLNPEPSHPPTYTQHTQHFTNISSKLTTYTLPKTFHNNQPHTPQQKHIIKNNHINPNPKPIITINHKPKIHKQIQFLNDLSCWKIARLIYINNINQPIIHITKTETNHKPNIKKFYQHNLAPLYIIPKNYVIIYVVFCWARLCW